MLRTLGQAGVALDAGIGPGAVLKVLLILLQEILGFPLELRVVLALRVRDGKSVAGGVEDCEVAWDVDAARARHTVCTAGARDVDVLVVEPCDSHHKLIVLGRERLEVRECRDILAQLPSELGISLTESCAMIPEASICGLVIAHRDASYRSVGKVSAAALERYSELRGFSSEQRELFLSALQ